MLHVNAVFASDSLCRDNTRFTPGALLHGLRGAWEIGTPSFLSHDFHRPIGWTAPRAVYLEPGLARLFGNITLVDRDEDGPLLRKIVLGFLQRRVEDRAAEFEVLAQELEDALTENADRLSAECIALWDPGLAAKTFPQLFRLRDEDGLIPISELDVIAPGVYRIGRLAVFAHPYFRRGLSPFNTLNGAFLLTLHGLPENVRPRVALDPDMVGLADSYQWQLEHQYWWGPPFSDELASIPTGVTVHQATDEQRLFHGISRTEFWWQSRKGLHILEVEEVRDNPTFKIGPDPAFGCRYAHSIVVEETGELDHFDGAVRTYSEEQMIERLEAALPETGRDKDYTKLWRIDGEVDTPTWKRLLSDYFRDNQLVGEYLGADAASAEAMDADSAADPRDDRPRSRVETLVPVKKGDGPRVSLFFRPLLTSTAPYMIVPLRGFDAEKRDEPFVELATLDFVKALRSAGHVVSFPDDVLLYEADDLYYNLPMLWHSSADAVGASVNALLALSAAWMAQETDGAVSVTLAYPIGEEGFAISLRGHIADVNELLTAWDHRVRPHLLSPEAVADSIAALLSGWPETHDDHDTFKGAFRTGLLDFPRLLLSSAEVTPRFDANGIRGDLVLDREADPRLGEEVENGRLRMSAAWLLTDPGCDSCGGHYRTCSCSSLLDQASVDMGGVRLIHVILTDRPA